MKLNEIGAVLSKKHRDKLQTAHAGMVESATHVLDVIDASAPKVDPLQNEAVQPYPADDEVLLERNFSAEQRAGLAKSGAALPGGGFPIQTKGDLSNAVQAFGRAKNKVAAKAHIKKRARALGATASLPDSWGTKESIDAQESERSFDQLKDMVAEAIAAEYGGGDNPYGPGRYTWVCDMYDSYAIYSVGGDYFSIPWAIRDNAVVLGEPTEVVRSYIADDEPIGDGDNDADDGVLAPAGVPNTSRAAESLDIELTGDTVTLMEKSLRKDGTATVKFIQPGWGSSAYYPLNVLKEQGPLTFKRGLHMHMDHPTEAEMETRPERSVSTLAGVLESDAYWLDNGVAGPGLYSDIKVMGPFKEVFDDIAPHIGVSIRARGKAKDGEAEGRRGKILEKFEAADSIDFVTTAGAGGTILPLFESARARQQTKQEGTDMADEQIIAQLQEAQLKIAAQDTALARVQESLAISQAEQMVGAALAGVKLPGPTRTRLSAALASDPPMADGKLDRAAFATRIQESLKAEVDYLESVYPSGQIVGMGANPPAPEFDDTQFGAALTEALTELGLSGDALTHAVTGRR